jgi:hypothetical protein
VVAKQRNLQNYQIQTKHNLIEYLLETDAGLNKTITNIEVTYPHDPVKSKDIAWFMESIFYARRRSFGKNYVSAIQ